MTSKKTAFSSYHLSPLIHFKRSRVMVSKSKKTWHWSLTFTECLRSLQAFSHLIIAQPHDVGTWIDANLQVRKPGLKEIKSLVQGYISGRAKKWTQAWKALIFVTNSPAWSMTLLCLTYCPPLGSEVQSWADGPRSVVGSFDCGIWEHNEASRQALPKAQGLNRETGQNHQFLTHWKANLGRLSLIREVSLSGFPWWSSG